MLLISKLTVENLPKNCVTDNPSPGISFRLESDRQNVTLSRATVKVGNWQTDTTEQIMVRYQGEPLKPFTSYTVEVTAVDNYGETASASATFETGRLNNSWRAKWITDSSYIFSDKQGSPLPMTFRKKLILKDKIKCAKIYATALGIYELDLNGQKVGNQYFAPGLTSYAHQLQYQIYDVTKILSGDDTLVAVVGGGWAVGSFTNRRVNRISENRQALLFELHVLYENGDKDVVCSDESWQVSEEGNYRFAEFYDGETYDATVKPENMMWKQAGIATLRSHPAILAQYGYPVTAHETMKPLNHLKTKSGEIIYDFGQNFAGVIHARIKGKSGQQITFRHAEVLVDGELYLKALRTAKAVATYVCTEGEQEYSPRFTYMGFRYVGVAGIDEKDLELSAKVIHSDFEETGSFSCSNELINKLQSNIKWGGKSNFVDIPTDCPQRDERMGWTGDFAVFAPTACFNFDMSRFIDKWLLDMKAEQSKGGGIPMVIPRCGDTWPVFATSCWGDSCITVPWAEYLARGDKELLRRQYPVMKKFLKAAGFWAGMLSVGKNRRHIWRWLYHWGDWCAPGQNVSQWVLKGKWVGTAYWANSCATVAGVARVLGKPEDEVYYRKLYGEICGAYRKVLTDRKGRLKKEFQTGYVLPLYFGMTQGEETKAMANHLARLVKNADYHLATGFTGTPYLLFALSDNGHVEEAFQILMKDTCPSWLYEVKSGGTTIWERWDALRGDGSVNISSLTDPAKDDPNGGMVSFNHYANGAVGDWLYRRVAGIEATSGGYKTFKIAPLVGGDITSARGSVKTPYGEIVSDWAVNDQFKIVVEVPVSTICTLILPSGEHHQLKSGRYTFFCPIDP